MLGNGMKHPFSLLFVSCLFIMIHTASSDVPAGHAKIESPAILDSVTLLKSAKDDAEKLKYLDEINHLYMDNALLILTKFRYDEYPVQSQSRGFLVFLVCVKVLYGSAHIEHHSFNHDHSFCVSVNVFITSCFNLKRWNFGCQLESL